MQHSLALALVASILAGLAGTAEAQVHANSSGLLLQPLTPGATHVRMTAGTTYVAHMVVGSMSGGAAPAGVSTSVNYPASMWIGAVSSPATFYPPDPIVVATVPEFGDADGGETLRVFGFGLDDPTTVVELGPVTALSLSVLANTEVKVKTPHGRNEFGNPLGSVDVKAVVAGQEGTLARGFVFTPAMVEDAPTHVGGSMRTSVLMPPLSLYGISWGKAIDGFALPLPPFEGALELISPLVSVSPLLLSTDGVEAFTLPIVNDPTLVGAVLQWQALVITNLAPLEGSFTNRLLVELLP